MTEGGAGIQHRQGCIQAAGLKVGQVPHMPGVPMGNMTHVNIQHEAAVDSIPAADVRAINVKYCTASLTWVGPNGRQT